MIPEDFDLDGLFGPDHQQLFPPPIDLYLLMALSDCPESEKEEEDESDDSLGI